MKDLKNKLTEKLDDAKKVAEEKIKEAKLDEKLKDVKEKASKAIEEAEVSDKVAKVVNDENKQALKEKTCALKDKTCALTSKVKSCKCVKPLLIGLAGVIGAAVLVCAVMSMFSNTVEVQKRVNGEVKTITYIFEDNKLFGEAEDITTGGTIYVKPKKVSDGIFAAKVVGFQRAMVYNHSKSGLRIEGVKYVIKAKDALFGADLDIVLKPAVFTIEDFQNKLHEVKGYEVYTFNPKMKFASKEPDFKLVYTKYDEPKK